MESNWWFTRNLKALEYPTTATQTITETPGQAILHDKNHIIISARIALKIHDTNASIDFQNHPNEDVTMVVIN